MSLSHSGLCQPGGVSRKLGQSDSAGHWSSGSCSAGRHTTHIKAEGGHGGRGTLTKLHLLCLTCDEHLNSLYSCSDHVWYLQVPPEEKSAQWKDLETSLTERNAAVDDAAAALAKAK